MASVNKVIILGNLGQDPELRNTTSGKAVTTLRVATTDTWNDASGQRQEKTEWHTIVVWGRTAENCKQYLSKGRSVYVEGRLQTRKWQDKEGHDRYSTEIVAEAVPGARVVKGFNTLQASVFGRWSICGRPIRGPRKRKAS